MQTLYTKMKVNNEIELCEIYSLELKTEIERALLQERISYFIRWPKVTIFSRHKFICVFCVNENSVEDAEAVITQICEESGQDVKYLMRRSSNDYL